MLGEKINEKEFERKQLASKKKNIENKKQSIENKFLKIYNRQGHHSMNQSLVNVYGEICCKISRVI